MLSDQQFLRYQRQISIPEIGETGQLQLSKAHVLIIGCGGLGSAASLYLAAAGVGKLVIVDDDDVDCSNLQRQVIYREGDIGASKTTAVTKQLSQVNHLVQVRAINKRLDKSQLLLEVMLADVVLDCSDNMPTRQLINSACFERSTPLISAAAIGWQGQFAVFDFQAYEGDQPCYRCLFPFDELPRAQSCSENGIVGPVVGTLGNYQALAAIQKIATGMFHVKPFHLNQFDGMQMQWSTMAIGKDKACQVCSEG
ncbi:HesA/MoeB/ThiF family protein [Vibrio aquaticus]|uniref:HesA/MoeB/ThiF family protein n=1 Tax=Vibrio aquaticus TaxID=2496559 RepID=A0A432CSF3_9VIBR|nr:HesA/MoeB/ThiF family protein [Vibrio aquaticus]RTZ14170.1 HesA/MoeB/ThiF family protein [Vibrio aquaticus]